LAKPQTHLTKQELKTPDEFLTWGTRAAVFAEKNLALVAVGAVALLALAGGVYAMGEHRETQEVEASSKLYEGEKKLKGNDMEGPLRGMHFPGMNEAKAEDMQAALVIFRSVAAEYPGSRAERRAHLLAGDTAFKLKDYDGAAKEYDAVSGGSDVERYYALSGRAHSLEAKEAWDDAATTYRKIVDDKTLLDRDLAELDLARILARSGKADQARTLLAKFKTDFPNSSVQSDADARLTDLGGDPNPVASAAPSTTPGAD
jgi:tetratricopeptide (TPR) repeat protein